MINEESVRGGWEATLYGRINATALGASVATDRRLVVIPRLFIGDHPGCPEFHVGARLGADVLRHALHGIRRVLRRVLGRVLRRRPRRASPR